MRGQPLELLLNGLVVDLVAGRDAPVDRYAHGTPPAGSGTTAPWSARAGSSPTAGGAGRPDPRAAGRSRSARRCAERARCVAAAAACSSPRRVTSPGSWGLPGPRSPPRARGQLSRSCPGRVRQILSFVIRPLRRLLAGSAETGGSGGTPGLPPEEWSSLRYGSREPKEDGSMSRKRHRAEEIVAKLRQVEVLTAQGRPVAEAIRSIGVTEVAPRRAAQRRDLLYAPGGQDHHRGLASPLQSLIRMHISLCC